MVNPCIFLFDSLRFDIVLNGVFIPMSADCIHIISFGPKFPTPKLLLYFGMQPENLFRCDTLDCPNYLCWAHRGNTLYQKMNMILVGSDLDKLHLISF